MKEHKKKIATNFAKFSLLELAEVEIPETVHGESLVSLLRGEKDDFRDFVVTSHALYTPGQIIKIVDGKPRGVAEPPLSTVTTPRWTFLYATEDYPAQLYDIENDPSECRNIINENWEVAKGLHHKFVKFLENLRTDEQDLTPRRRLRKH